MIDRIISSTNHIVLRRRKYRLSKLEEEILKEYIHFPESEVLVVAIPGWGSSFLRWNGLEKFVKEKKYSLLTYEFPREIVSVNLHLTGESFHKSAQIIRKDISNFKEKYNFKRIVILAYSLGVTLAALVYKENHSITDIVLVCPGNDIAEDMWFGCHTQFLRKVYEKKGGTLARLKNDVKNLAFEKNLPAREARTLIYYGKYDEVVKNAQGRELLRVLREHNLRFKSKEIRMGHYLTCAYFLKFPERFIQL